MNALHFGDPDRRTGRSVRNYSPKRSAFARTSNSQQLRVMSKSNPNVKPIRLGVETVLGWLRSPQCDNFNKSSATRFLAGPWRQATSNTCSSDSPPAIRFNTRSFDLLATRSILNRWSKHSTLPACHHSTSSHPHSSVHHMEIAQVRQLCHEVAHVKQWELLVTALMKMMIHHAQQKKTQCVTGAQVQSCVKQISPFHGWFRIRY